LEVPLQERRALLNRVLVVQPGFCELAESVVVYVRELLCCLVVLVFLVPPHFSAVWWLDTTNVDCCSSGSGCFTVLLAVRMSISMLTVCFDFHQFRQVPTAAEINSSTGSKTTLCYDNPHGIVDSTLKLGKDKTCI
jgi:hypothetical protein